MKNAGVYAKTIIAVFGAAITALGPYLAAYKWWPAIPAVLTALTVYLVPNASPVGVPAEPANPEPVTPPAPHPVP